MYWEGWSDEDTTTQHINTLKNAPASVNSAIDEYNKLNPKRLYKGKKLPLHDVTKLREEMKYKCSKSGRLLKTQAKLIEHLEWHTGYKTAYFK